MHRPIHKIPPSSEVNLVGARRAFLLPGAGMRSVMWSATASGRRPPAGCRDGGARCRKGSMVYSCCLRPLVVSVNLVSSHPPPSDGACFLLEYMYKLFKSGGRMIKPCGLVRICVGSLSCTPSPLSPSSSPSAPSLVSLRASAAISSVSVSTSPACDGHGGTPSSWTSRAAFGGQLGILDGRAAVW